METGQSSIIVDIEESRGDRKLSFYVILFILLFFIEAVVAQGHKGVIVTTVVGSIATRGSEIFIYIYILISPLERSVALSSATQLNSTQNASRTRQTLNTRFPLPTPLYAGYSVKLI